ncbi:MAG: hypothetical protein ABI612_23965 [Betaproteobacteria bacterium]
MIDSLPVSSTARAAIARAVCYWRDAKVTRSVASVALVTLAAVLAASAAHAQTPPKQFQKLYHELDSQLSAFEIHAPRSATTKEPIHAANLTSASCQRGEIMLGESERQATLLELDGLKRLRATAVVVQICYPLLTQGFRDPQPFIDYYANLANEIRLRGMKLLVEHGTLSPSYSATDPAHYYRKLTKPRFEAERFDELKTILLAVQPDYLTLVSEPNAQAAGLKLTVKDWRRYVSHAVETLAQERGSFATLLGAGSGLWDDFGYVRAFAGIKGLAYIDLHLYALTSKRDSMLARLLAFPDRIRAIDPDKRVVMSGIWLAKLGADGAASSFADPRVAARDVFGFWLPLDRKFLNVVAATARAKGIELIAPSRSGYLFAYVDYNDSGAFGLSAKGLLGLARERAAQALSAGRFTDTGFAFRDM